MRAGLVASSDFRGTTAHGGGAYAIRVLWPAGVELGRSPFPEGTAVCAEHRAGRDEGPLTCMRKGPDGWTYAVAVAPFSGWSRIGKLDDCAGCHRTAPHDGVFGPLLTGTPPR